MKVNVYPGGLLLAVALLLMTPTADATQNLWRNIESLARLNNTQDATTAGFKHRRLQLDEQRLRLLTENLQSRSSGAADLTLELPLPDGRFATVRLRDSALLSADIAQKFPALKTWHLESDDQEILSGSAELTSLGFHAMLLTRTGDRLFIEPEQRTENPANRTYHSHSQRTNSGLTAPQQTFSCGQIQTQTFSPASEVAANPQIDAAFARRAGESRLTYRLAVATTGEYTAQFGGSKVAALGAVTTTVNRINTLFNQELAIHLRLVSGTEVIFKDSATDPYDNGSAFAMANQNQPVLDSRIGANNYDIGHVLGFTAGGDGVAFVKSICGSNKAKGSTSAAQLLTDAFIIDFVAHEIGHQLGATHTFNGVTGQCGGGSQRIGETAFEPGSGSTIMSYAGICGSDDFQRNADPHFHQKTIEQILNATHNGTAARCALSTNLNNKVPIVTTTANRIIPARTPFILSGSASDSDGDTLRYSWDQVDAGTASNLGVDTTDNALIKSSPLAATGIRYVPDLMNLLSTSQRSSSGESLPRSDRVMNFRLSARDGKGATAHADMKLTVKDTGQRFEILAPGNNIAAGAVTVRWNTAETEKAPINCRNVDIAYTNNRGKTFIDVLRNTPNDGNQSINLGCAAQRIRVKCSNNVFFALSGTIPHLSSYQSANSQNSDLSAHTLQTTNAASSCTGDNEVADDSDTSTGSNNNAGNANEGGGGSVPFGLLLTALFLYCIRCVSIHSLRRPT